LLIVAERTEEAVAVVNAEGPVSNRLLTRLAVPVDVSSEEDPAQARVPDSREEAVLETVAAGPDRTADAGLLDDAVELTVTAGPVIMRVPVALPSSAVLVNIQSPKIAAIAVSG
jgi:hypothetical protein